MVHTLHDKWLALGPVYTIKKCIQFWKIISDLRFYVAKKADLLEVLLRKGRIVLQTCETSEHNAAGHTPPC